MNYCNIYKTDCLNGVGWRTVLFVTGCTHACKGCFNKATWNPKSGLEFTDSVKSELFEYADNPYVDGLTISGGDPLHKRNVLPLIALVSEFKEKFSGKTIWLYTGYCFEKAMEDTDRAQLISMVDVVVDGKFMEDLKDPNILYRGSVNQRVINVKDTLLGGEVMCIGD